MSADGISVIYQVEFDGKYYKDGTKLTIDILLVKMNINYGRMIFILLLLFSVFFFCECKKHISDEIITIGLGLGMDPNTPTMALEVSPRSNRFFLFMSNPVKDSCHYYSGTLDINETEYVKRYILRGLVSLDTLRYAEIDDATKIEVSRHDGNGISKHGFGHYSSKLQQDSIIKIIELAQNALDLRCISFHNFETSIQYEALPTPPTVK